MSNHLNQVLLVGAGYMGQEYCKVLQALRVDFLTVGRGEASGKNFYEKTGMMPYIGGLSCFIEEKDRLPLCAIVAVNVEELYKTVKLLLTNGVKTILVEKPGAVFYEQIRDLDLLAEINGASIFVAYNRRFYASVRKAQELIAEDGGVSSFRFEFTEWSHKIAGLNKVPEALHEWFLCNSTHVVDLAFYLGGKPEHMCSYTMGSLDWYDKAGSFSGAGITGSGASFSYCADWESAGRWCVEILTKKGKLILCPLEELRCQLRGSLVVDQLEIDDAIDRKFKPGLYLQTRTFLEGSFSDLLALREHVKMCEVYQQMENGTVS